MTDAFFYSPCILRTGANGGTCGVKNTEGACQPTPMPTTAAPTISAAPTLSPTLSSVPTSKPSAVPTADPTGAPTVAPTMDWTTFCETKNTTSACTAEVGCHWLDPYSRCIPECAFGIDNRDACDTRYCSWRWTPKLPITGKCLECDAARKYETCDCGDASWGSAASRQTRGGRRNLKFGYVELNTGFVVEGSVELDGVSLADAEAHAADITSTIIDVAGGVRPADVTTCASATTTTPTCTVENQLCTTGAGTTAEKKYCCIMDEAGSGAWTAGACAPDFDDITVILSEPSSRRRLAAGGAVLVEYQIQVPEGSDAIADVWADALSMAPAKYPADATICKGWSCSTEQQYCPQGLPGSKWSDFCCTDGRWTKGGCDLQHMAWRNTLDARVAAKNDHDCSAAADPNTVGDGKCDAANNVAPCYDGGDCCEATCPSSRTGCGGTYSYAYDDVCVNTLAMAGRNVTEVGAAAVTTKKDYCNDYCGKYWTCLDG